MATPTSFNAFRASKGHLTKGKIKYVKLWVNSWFRFAMARISTSAPSVIRGDLKVALGASAFHFRARAARMYEQLGFEQDIVRLLKPLG
jgi:hypothetical protein